MILKSISHDAILFFIFFLAVQHASDAANILAPRIPPAQKGQETLPAKYMDLQELHSANPQITGHVCIAAALHVPPASPSSLRISSMAGSSVMLSLAFARELETEEEELMLQV